jgi:hypothetical protein
MSGKAAERLGERHRCRVSRAAESARGSGRIVIRLPCRRAGHAQARALDGLSPGRQNGDFVAFEVMELNGHETCCMAYAWLSGLLPRDPNFSTKYNDALRGGTTPTVPSR